MTDPVAVYWCPACGARYATAGECAAGHPPVELEQLDQAAAASDGSTPAPAAPVGDLTQAELDEVRTMLGIDGLEARVSALEDAAKAPQEPAPAAQEATSGPQPPTDAPTVPPAAPEPQTASDSPGA